MNRFDRVGFISKIEAFCAEHDMLPRGGTLLCAVSGGTDSMCLLSVAAELGREQGFGVAAAHYNHRLRADESDGDELFVRDWCAGHGIPFTSGGGDVAAEAARRGAGIEETARDMRYAFLREAAEKTGALRIATAHNADDNLETLLLNLTRGTGLKGLGGIPPVRDGIIRPLLTVSRAEIESFLKAESIPHREDSTNAMDEYSRNVLRHSVIPVLRKINPSVTDNAAVAIGLLRRDEDFLDSLAADFIEKNERENALPASALVRLPESVSSRVVRQMWPSSLSAEHVKAVLALAASPDPSARLDIPGGRVCRQYDLLLFGGGEAGSFRPVTIGENDCAVLQEAGLSVSCTREICPDTVNKSFTTFLFPCDKICGKLTVRPRMTGDEIALAGGGRTKSLKKLFIERKIPAGRRQAVPVVADDEGPLAVYGIGRGSRALPEPGRQVYKITFTEINSVEKRT